MTQPGKQLQYRYCPISQKERQSDKEICSVNITWETIFLKYYKQNVVEKLFPDVYS